MTYYTVTFIGWNGVLLKTELVKSGNNASPPHVSPPEGYTFTGWSGTYTNITSDRSISATFSNVYTVTFEDWDGSVLKSELVFYGNNATPPTNLTRSGHTFTRWSGNYTNVTFSRTITAVYDAILYTVTFKDWDGSVLKSELVFYGNNATPPPTNPTRSGYTFTGWDSSYTNVTSSRTITAVYDAILYSVTFKDWNGSVLKSQQVIHGNNATPPTNPTRSGYTFTGWSGSYTNVTSNRTITALYTQNTVYYTVTFKDWNGSVLKSQTLESGRNATPPTNPTRSGYTFTGWSGSYTNVTSSRTITAVYTQIMCNVIFWDYDNTILLNTTVAYGSAAGPPPNPSRAGYIFDGWSEDYTNITENKNIIALYKISSSTLIYQNINGVWVESVAMYMKVNNEWVEVLEILKNINGIWKS